MKTRRVVVMVLIFLGLCSGTMAQWTTQQVPLQPGWNSVFLYVQPEPANCDTLFSGVPIEQVSAFNDVFSPIQYTVDPSVLTPNGPDWLQWFPTSHPLASTRNLQELRIGRGYLVKVATNASPFSLQITGVPEHRIVEWRESRYNLAGFLVSTSSPPSFASFFAGSSAHTGPVYRLVGGSWINVSTTNLMGSGEAFWVYVNGASQFQGPLELADVQRAGLDYGNTLQELALSVRNAASSNRTVTVTCKASGPPGAGSDISLLAGSVPVSWWDPSGGAWGQWRDFASNGFSSITRVLAPGEDASLRFAVRRQDMAAFQPPPGALGHYASLLEVLDSGGARALIPIRAQGLTLPGTTSIVSRTRAGLWVGDVLMEAVNQPIAFDTQVGHNPTNPVPVDPAAAFSMRVIVHLDTNDAVRLLPEVNILWKDGVYTTNQWGVASNLVPGRYALITKRALLPQYVPASGEESATGARRISAALVPGTVPLVLTRGSNAAVNTFSTTVDVGYNDALNPFKHAFHPSHDNLQPSGRYLDVRTNAAGLAYTAESFSVRRKIALTFAGSDEVDPASAPSFGDNVLAGYWDETVTGLRSQPICARGRFILHKVSDACVLDDGK